ncbi:MAG: TonB-dependent receptor, partial [Pyrinomonadaceae bacterium]|nr:TonB-dependent receptor [Pyrinomonadaceae bacterium]
MKGAALMRHAVLFAFGVFLSLLLLPAVAITQSNLSSVTGRMLDQNGAVISGARVILRQAGTGFTRTTETDAAGVFRFAELVNNSYSLSATAQGFSSSTQEIAVSAGETREVDITLQAGAIAEQVAINATRITDTLEAIERVPGAVDVIDPKTLEDSRAFNFSEVLRKVSGLNVRDEEGFGLRPNIGIRGLNPTRSTKVLLLEDGLPLTYAPYGDNASYYHPPVERFESVEVLKGSGQILYGPVTVGGVINYITPAPPVKPAGYVKLIAGNRSYFNGHINYGRTWKGTGLLFDFTRKQGAGARDNTRSGLNDFNFKAVRPFGTRQALSFKFNYYGENSNVTYSGLTEAEYRANPRQNPFRNDFFYGNRFGASATHTLIVNNNLFLTTSVYGAFFRRHWWRQSSNSNERPNRLSTLAGGDPDCRGMIDLNTTCGNQGRLRQYYFAGVEPRFRANFRLFNFSNEADFGFRLHYEDQERVQKNGDLPTSRDGLVVENNERKTAAYSAFVQNRFIFGDWTVTPGLRVERVNYQRTNRLAFGGVGVTGTTHITQLIPGLGVSYSPSEKITVFAGVHRGFAPPRTEDIINNTTGGSIDLDSELSWNYEVGFRSLPTPGLRLEATFFRMDYENQIVPASLAGGIGATLTNGGETRHQGIELTGRVDTGTIFKSRHNVYVRTAYTFLPISEFTGTRFSSVGGFTLTSVSGNRLPYSPEHLLNASFGYSNPSGFDGFIESVYVGRQFSDDLNRVTPTANGQAGLIPSYISWNATGNYRSE